MGQETEERPWPLMVLERIRAGEGTGQQRALQVALVARRDNRAPCNFYNPPLCEASHSQGAPVGMETRRSAQGVADSRGHVPHSKDAHAAEDMCTPIPSARPLEEPWIQHGLLRRLGE